MGQYPYWPAKIISTENQFIDIQFFGDHMMATVTADEYLLYLKKRPERNSNKKISKSLKSALKVKKCFKLIKLFEFPFRFFFLRQEAEAHKSKSEKDSVYFFMRRYIRNYI